MSDTASGRALSHVAERAIVALHGSTDPGTE